LELGDIGDNFPGSSELRGSLINGQPVWLRIVINTNWQNRFIFEACEEALSLDLHDVERVSSSRVRCVNVSCPPNVGDNEPATQFTMSRCDLKSPVAVRLHAALA